MEFDTVIAPLTRAEFLRDHWDKSFVRVPGAAGRFSGLLTWDELNGILEQHRLTPPRIKLYQNGQPIEPQRFLTPARFGVPRLDAGGLAACLAQGATLILDDAQEVAPRVGLLMHAFQDALATDAFANLYASWHSQNGFDLHWDPQSSVILQLAGRKRWQIYRPTRLHPLEGDAPERPTGEPLWDGMMEDGDALYIPRGWWHVAWPVDEPSLHLTVSLIPPNGLDFLGWAVAKLRAQDQLRANLPALAGAPALAAHVKTLRRLLDEVLSEQSAAEFLRAWQANIRPSPRIRLQNAPYQQLAALTQNSRIRLAGLHRIFFDPNGANFEFKAAGRLWTVPPELVAAFQLLSNSRDVTLDELARACGPAAVDRLHKSIAVLARAGVVLVENG